MKSHVYIVSQKKNRTNYISQHSLDNALMSLKIQASSHWWDGFLITCVPEESETETLEYLKHAERTDTMVVAQSVNEYHNWTKQYWIKQDQKLEKPMTFKS